MLVPGETDVPENPAQAAPGLGIGFQLGVQVAQKRCQCPAYRLKLRLEYLPVRALSRSWNIPKGSALVGVEPTTLWLTAIRSNLLSYKALWLWHRIRIEHRLCVMHKVMGASMLHT